MCIHEHVILISVQINKTILFYIVIFQNDKKNNQEYVLIGQIAI